MQITNSNKQLTNIQPVTENISTIKDNTTVIQANITINKPIIAINERKLQQITIKNHCDINEHNIRNIPLTSSLNTEEFTEVTKRIKKSQLAFIDKQLSCVNNQDLTNLQLIYNNPELILTTKNIFFSDGKFPFIVLKALQLGLISTFEFASLQTWHEVYKEQKLLNPDNNPQLYNLLNTDNSYNKEAWEIITASIESCNSSLKEDVIQINNSQVITTLRQQAIMNSAIDNCLLLFKLTTPIDKNGLYKKLMNSGIKFFSIYQNNRISTSIALYQNFLDATFTNNLCKINPVIGISSPENIRNSGYRLQRDFAIPFPGNPFPQYVHEHFIKEILEFQYHDIYHIFHMCLMSPESIKFYLTIGDALLDLKNKCDATINCLTQLIVQKLDKLEFFKNKIIKMQANNRIKAEKILFNEFYCIKKILQLLKNMRKAYGQFKFEMYDADVMHFENREIKLLDKYEKNGIYLLNIILLLVRKNKKSPVLSGFPAQLAGKTVMKTANDILDMHSAYKYFTNYFDNELYVQQKSSIVDFLTGVRKYFENM